MLCGEDQNTRYKETFIGYKIIEFDEKSVGCALACAPYVTLARNAIPQGCNPSNLTEMTIGQWEQALGLPPLSETSQSEHGYLGKGVLDDS